MPDTPLVLDPTADIVALATTLIDWESPSGAEKSLADAIFVALSDCSHLTVLRVGNTVVAKTTLGRPHRVIWAGHIDTVPANNNLPSNTADGWLWGRGSVDMKAGVAIGFSLACSLTDPVHDVTWVFYDNEEVESAKNGLGIFAASHPEWMKADLAIVGEPTGGVIEGGCNGTLRCVVTTTGTRAHSARSWMGENAIHKASDVLNRLVAYKPQTVSVEGLEYREGMNAVGISGGVAGNVIPDRCEVTVNYRFAPDKTVHEAEGVVRDLFDGFHVTVVDSAPGAKPGLNTAFAQDFATSMGSPITAKYGWTDVARFGQWGIPALNFGPGDPSLAHADDERVEIANIRVVHEALRAWLRPQP